MKRILFVIFIIGINADLQLTEPVIKHAIHKYVLSNDIVKLHGIQYVYNNYYNNTIQIPKDWFIGNSVSIAVLKNYYNILEYLHNWKKINKNDIEYDNGIAIKIACKYGRLRILKYFKYHMNVNTSTFNKYQCSVFSLVNNRKYVTKWLSNIYDQEYYARKYELTYHYHEHKKQYIMENTNFDACNHIDKLLPHYLYKHDITEASNIVKLCPDEYISFSSFNDLIIFSITSDNLHIIEFIRKNTYVDKIKMINYIPLICEYTNIKILHYMIHVIGLNTKYIKNSNCKEISKKYNNIKFNQLISKYQ